MSAKKCDRYGKLYKHYDGDKEFKQTEKANELVFVAIDEKECEMSVDMKIFEEMEDCGEENAD